MSVPMSRAMEPDMLQCTCIDMHEYLYLIEVYADLVKAPVFYATYYLRITAAYAACGTHLNMYTCL